MKWYRADMHIHTVLSPCGDLDMSPVRIISNAKNKKLDIIGITDHNSTYHCRLMIELGKKNGITVIPGVEITTAEEVHCLAFFENADYTDKFQEFILEKLPKIKNNSEKFGMQLVVNEQEEVISELDDLLITSLGASIEELEQKVHSLDGIFIPAHADRAMNGIYSQMGFISDDLKLDALELSGRLQFDEYVKKKPELKQYSIIKNSDAHYPQDIARSITEYYLREPSFFEWVKAIKKQNGRQIRIL